MEYKGRGLCIGPGRDRHYAVCAPRGYRAGPTRSDKVALTRVKRSSFATTSPQELGLLIISIPLRSLEQRRRPQQNAAHAHFHKQDTMVPKLSSKHLDLNLGAKSWRPLQRGERSETGGIHAHRGRFLASSTGSLPSSPSASLLGDPRVHFASPGSSDKAPSSAGRLTPSSASAGLGPGMTDEEFERHAKELSDAQAAQFAAAEAQRLAQAAADAEAAEELQRKKMEELLNAQAELAAREREVKDKEDRIAALMRQEEERHAADVRKMEELARKEEEERRARLEKLDREEAERKANLEKLEAQRREERAVEEEQEVIRRLEEERQRLANEERLAIENKIKEEEEAEKAAKAAMRSKLLAYVPMS